MVKTPFASFRRVAACMAAAGLLAACDGDVAAPDSARPQFTSTPDIPPIVLLCKVGPAGTTATFNISRSADVGTLNHGSTVTVTATETLDVNKCKTVWTAKSPDDPAVELTFEEIVPDGMSLVYTKTESVCHGITENEPGVNPVVISASYNCAAGVLFENRPTPPPPPPPPPTGGEGCTPGYWKQRQHFDSWPAPYTPDTPFADVFADAFPGKTLLEVVRLGGGGLNALGRHTVAALLSSGSVSYGMHTADVISAFNAAYASGDYDALHKQLEGLNEAGCPLN